MGRLPKVSGAVNRRFPGLTRCLPDLLHQSATGRWSGERDAYIPQRVEMARHLIWARGAVVMAEHLLHPRLPEVELLDGRVPIWQSHARLELSGLR